MNRLRLGVLVAAFAFFASVSTASATYPRHNGLIVFGAVTEGGSQLFTVRSNGHDLHQIAFGPGEAVHPDWSPDGRTIVYEHDWDTETQCATVDLINPDGSNRVSLTTGVGGCEGQPSFTPDGAAIVYEHFDFTTFDDAVWGMNADGSNQHRIIGPWPNGQGFATDPNVSPDGKDAQLRRLRWKPFRADRRTGAGTLQLRARRKQLRRTLAVHARPREQARLSAGRKSPPRRHERQPASTSSSGSRITAASR
jgi:hypothetical protein